MFLVWESFMYLWVSECSSREEPKAFFRMKNDLKLWREFKCWRSIQVERSSQYKTRGSRWRGLVIVIQPLLWKIKEGVFICLSQLVILICDTILISSFLWVSPLRVGVDGTMLKLICVIYLFFVTMHWFVTSVVMENKFNKLSW